jgi:hypothetical protein
MYANLTYESSKDKEDTDDDPGLYGGEPLRLGDVGGDGVEDVHQYQEHRDQQGHPAHNSHILLWTNTLA